jgi:hypothetical protein
VTERPPYRELKSRAAPAIHRRRDPRRCAAGGGELLVLFHRAPLDLDFDGRVWRVREQAREPWHELVVLDADGTVLASYPAVAPANDGL